MEQDESHPPRQGIAVLAAAVVVVVAVAAFVSEVAVAWKYGPGSRTPRAEAWQSAAARRRFVASPSLPQTLRSSPGKQKAMATTAWPE